MINQDVISKMERFLIHERHSSLIVSVENDVFWARTVIKQGSHIEGEGKSLTDAFEALLNNYFNEPES